MQVLQQARLETGANGDAARRSEGIDGPIAAEHGFSSPTRFAQSFRRKSGVYPSEALRERRFTLAG
jgi:transcriptional regulator GlxA family with amidase domain